MPDADRLLPETARAVAGLVATAQTTGPAPTVLAGVVRGGALIEVAGAGNGPGSAAVDPDTQFRIGSITKTMTAALVLQQRDAGVLALDDLLYRHLPGTPVGGVTLRQLLGHVAGLQAEPAGSWWERTPGVDLDTLLAAVSPDVLARPPYHGHHYSNLGYGLLGAVLVRVTGQPWAELLQTRLLEPLRMSRTTYHPAEPFARGYVVHPWHGTLREEPREDSGAMAPAGQLWSTLADLARWAGFLTDPDPAVLAPATVTQMYAPVVIDDPDGWTRGQGLGLQLWRCGERVYAGHSGSMPGYLAALVVHRPSRTAVVAFANAYHLQGGLTPLARQVLDAVLDREPVPPAPWQAAATPPVPEVAALCGQWWWMGQPYEVRWDSPAGAGALVLAGPAAPSRFARDGEGRWRGVAGPLDGEVLTVRRDPDGQLAVLEVATYLLTRDPDRVE